MTDTTRKDPADERFAGNLRTARERAGLSQGDLAALMADLGYLYHQNTITRIEKGARKVSIGEASDLARCVGSEVGALTRPPGLAQEAWLIRNDSRQARMAYEEALKQARIFTSIRGRLERRIARAESDGHAEALEVELGAARRTAALSLTVKEG